MADINAFEQFGDIIAHTKRCKGKVAKHIPSINVREYFKGEAETFYTMQNTKMFKVDDVDSNDKGTINNPGEQKIRVVVDKYMNTLGNSVFTASELSFDRIKHQAIEAQASMYLREDQTVIDAFEDITYNTSGNPKIGYDLSDELGLDGTQYLDLDIIKSIRTRYDELGEEDSESIVLFTTNSNLKNLESTIDGSDYHLQNACDYNPKTGRLERIKGIKIVTLSTNHDAELSDGANNDGTTVFSKNCFVADFSKVFFLDSFVDLKEMGTETNVIKTSTGQSTNMLTTYDKDSAKRIIQYFLKHGAGSVQEYITKLELKVK